MLLPEGIRRDNCKMYEEVEIPPNEPMPVGFEEKPVYISEIDEVGAAVFGYVCGDQQSAVGTNSAPTGLTPCLRRFHCQGQVQGERLGKHYVQYVLTEI